MENVSFADDSGFVNEPTFFEKQAPLVLTGLRYLIIPIAFVLIYVLFLRPVKKVVFATLSAAGPTPLATGQLVKSIPSTVGFPKIQTPMTVKQLEAQLQNGGTPSTPDAYASTSEREIMPLPGPSKMEVIRDRVIEIGRAHV